MKKLAITFFLLCSISSTVFGQNNSDEEKLKSLVQNLFDEVFSEMKMESIPDYLTDDFILLEHGEVWNLDKLRNMLIPGDRNGIERINEFEFLKWKISEKTAWIAYENKATFKKKNKIIGEMNWLESATAIKTKDGWKIDLLHSTRVPQAE